MKAAAAFLLVLGCLAVSHAWRCSGAPQLSKALQIDAGMGMVVATDAYKRAYFLSGRSWYRLGTTALKHVSVGPAGTWGTDAANRVHKLVAGNFKRATGLTMQQVDAGGGGQLVGSRPSTNLAYCLRKTSAVQYYGVGGIGWSTLSRALKYISCGPLYGCWGVDIKSNVFLTRTMSPTSCGTSGWIYVKGITMKMVEVGTDGSIFAVSTKGKVYQRVGIAARRPQGTAWRLVQTCMDVQHVSYDLRQLWVVTTSHILMTCTNVKSLAVIK
ncbi:fish-egg lectin-like [Pleuronectes platessa]|uniref:fish-egg lectin-like n=1 Tax=Pleuronectes platessa TaxID=8262 RepID=UPI00232A38A4|nr:fish-egg lectin-like [Pleuronectes platessa]